MVGLVDRHPATANLADLARRRLPFFAWEYLDSGTGAEALVDCNRTALGEIQMTSRVLEGRFDASTSAGLLGKS